MVYHNWKEKAEKKKAGISSPVDMSRCEERSWIQSRTVALLKETDLTGNKFTSDDWSRCYWQAVEEWNDKEEIQTDEEGD